MNTDVPLVFLQAFSIPHHLLHTQEKMYHKASVLAHICFTEASYLWSSGYFKAVKVANASWMGDCHAVIKFLSLSTNC